jgi:hypothetical protein
LQFLNVKKKNLEKSVIFTFLEPKNSKSKTEILGLEERVTKPQELKERKQKQLSFNFSLYT